MEKLPTGDEKNNSKDKQFPSAERRRKKAEEKGEASLSHYSGDLHTHTGGYDYKGGGDEAAPEDILKTRKGSNDAYIPTHVIGGEHQRRGDKFLGSTDHARDASPEKAVAGITNWFEDKYRKDPSEIIKQYGEEKWSEMSEEERNEAIRKRAKDLAEGVAFYGDERLLENLQRIEKWNEDNFNNLRIFKGIEASVLPDGSLDTPLVDEGKFELVNVSIHPEVDKTGFEEIVSDPEKYKKLVIQAMKNPRANIMCHIGFDCKPSMNEFNEKLDWKEIAETAVQEKVAVEINLNDLFRFLYKEILDEEKFPKDEAGYKKVFEEKLSELVPILSSDNIMSSLEPFFSKGLKLAINTDKHKSPFVEYDPDSESEPEIKPYGHRYWVCMKILERYINERFEKFDIKLENILNSHSSSELENFLRKESEKEI